MKILKYSYILYALKSPALSTINTLHGRLIAFLKFMFPVNSLERILYIWQRRKQLRLFQKWFVNIFFIQKKKGFFQQKQTNKQKNLIYRLDGKQNREKTRVCVSVCFNTLIVSKCSLDVIQNSSCWFTIQSSLGSCSLLPLHHPLGHVTPIINTQKSRQL